MKPVPAPGRGLTCRPAGGREPTVPGRDGFIPGREPGAAGRVPEPCPGQPGASLDRLAAADAALQAAVESDDPIPTAAPEAAGSACPKG